MVSVQASELCRDAESDEKEDEKEGALVTTCQGWGG